MSSFISSAWHYISGLAGIGAVAALAATGTVNGGDALTAIMTVTGALVGGGIAVAAAGSTTKAA